MKNFYRQMKAFFPRTQYEPEELPLEHEIFQCVYPPQGKAAGSEHRRLGRDGRTSHVKASGGTGPDTRTVHYKGIEDDKGRLMAIICHNTDLGDGWEREGEDEDYFHEISEKKSYPMGIKS